MQVGRSLILCYSNPVMKLISSSIVMNQINRDHCIRCGICCQKGGPTLHRQDLELFQEGTLKPSHVYTLRKGERVYHNVYDSVVCLDREMIKIKEQSGSRCCVFFDSIKKACTIYNQRPLQCKALQCWDTKKLEQVLTLPTLTRRDLVPTGFPFLEVLTAHDKRCSLLKLTELLKKTTGDSPDNLKDEIRDIVQYDSAIRPFMVNQAGIHESELDFFFGRPLSLLLQAHARHIELINGNTDALSPEHLQR